MRHWILASMLAYAVPAIAEDCSSVIALSKTVATVVTDQESLQQHAENFCREFARGNSSTSGTNFGASYKFLAASFGQSNASTEKVASKYCSASGNYEARRDAYRQYVESIAPYAYGAFEQCLKLSKSDLRFSVHAAGVLPKRFTLFAAFTSRVGGGSSADVAVSPSPGIKCTWRGSEDSGNSLRMESPSTAILDCDRHDQGEAGFVSVARTDGTDTEPMTLPWPAYDEKGNRIATIDALQNRLEQVEEKLSGQMVATGSFSISAAPGTRSLLDSSQCPSGSEAYRGQRNGRVTFDRAFLRAPRVIAAISRIDLGTSGNVRDTHRLSLSVSKIDREGFNYEFVTWCTTKVYGAEGAWMAVSQ